jgi:hypothetical protein
MTFACTVFGKIAAQFRQNSREEADFAKNR